MSDEHRDDGPCSCPICLGNSGEDAGASINPDRQPQMAPFYNDSQVIGQIDSGRAWSGGTITFGFLQSAPSWDMGYEGDGFSAFTAYQEQATRLAVSLWDDLIARSIVETGSSQQYADIKFGNTTSSIAYAHAYYPGNYDWAGEVWLNAQTYTGLYYPDPGDYYFMTVLHEAGHALGLSHPGAYNGGSPTYANDAVYAQDTHQWTVMSYFSASNTGADWNGGSGWQYAQTPMVHDVLAIQAIYGADTTTRTGNTTYGFNSTAGNDLFNFTLNSSPVVTIYDAGGTDTLDLSGFSQRAIINLEPGSYSSAGGTSSSMTYNIGIAGNTWIENAFGGSGSDNITGNSLDNHLKGNGGNDHLSGLAGNDIISGGGNIDWTYFDESVATYSFNFLTSSVEVHGDFVDTVLDDVEWLNFPDIAVTYQDLRTLHTAPLVQIETNGDVSLGSKAGWYVFVSGGGSNPGTSLIYQGQFASSSTFAGWDAVQVEDRAEGGFDVLWKNVDGSYSHWITDAYGSYQFSSSVSANALLDHETIFSADLNGDGYVGAAPKVPPTILESNGDVSLGVRNDVYLVVASDASETTITFQGKPTGPNTFAGWDIVQVENRAEGGYEVLWEHTDGPYSYWVTDANGAYQFSRSVSAGSLVDYETTFSADLNGDGYVGAAPKTPPTILESNGDVSLGVRDDVYLFVFGDDSEVTLTYQGQPTGPNTFSGWAVVQVEDRVGGGFEILWKNSDGLYSHWIADSNGAYQFSGSVSPGSLVDYETIFSADLNGDSSIGPPPKASPTILESNGDVSLGVRDDVYLFLGSDASETILTYQGKSTGPNTFAGWDVVQVEDRTGGGFQVLWEHTDGMYSYWTTDASGAYQFSRSVSAGSLPDYEAEFEVDLDGDGNINNALASYDELLS